MSDVDDDGIDWDSLRGACTNLSEIIWTYHQGLVAAGFDPGVALTLTIAYQDSWLKSAQNFI